MPQLGTRSWPGEGGSLLAPRSALGLSTLRWRGGESGVAPCTPTHRGGVLSRAGDPPTLDSALMQRGAGGGGDGIWGERSEISSPRRFWGAHIPLDGVDGRCVGGVQHPSDPLSVGLLLPRGWPRHPTKGTPSLSVPPPRGRARHWSEAGGDAGEKERAVKPTRNRLYRAQRWGAAM